MNRLIFEGRLLVNICGSIMRQDALYPVHGRLDWERMFRIADYHRIANLVYLSLIGNSETVPERWKNRFFERYQEALHFGEKSAASEKEILTLFDMQQISCVVLSSTNFRNLYQLPEMGANASLRLLLDEESYTLAKGYLVDLGYETDTLYQGFGEHMNGVSGFSVELYHKLPFELPSFEKGMRKLTAKAAIAPDYSYIRVLSVDDSFTYRMGEAVYHYVNDALSLREVMDLYLCHRAWREHMNESYVMGRLSEQKIDKLAKKLLYISYMWFGDKEECGFESPEEEMSAYDVPENRILSRGVITNETDEQALLLMKLIHAEERREQRREQIQLWKDRIQTIWKDIGRTRRWIFPDYHYMCTVYPILEKFPFLLPWFWVARGIRFQGKKNKNSNSESSVPKMQVSEAEQTKKSD